MSDSVHRGGSCEISRPTQITDDGKGCEATVNGGSSTSKNRWNKMFLITTRSPRQGRKSRDRILLAVGLFMMICKIAFELSFYTVNDAPPPTLDFVTAGNMKSGTSTLLYAFADHPEVEHRTYEMCFVSLPSFLGSWFLDRDVRQLSDTRSLQQGPNNIKLGLKCPLIAFNQRSIERIHHHSPQAKFILTFRHPVLTVESLYNYWVIVAYKMHLSAFIPSFATLVKLDPILSLGHSAWRGILSIARFEEYLSNFKRTVLRRKPSSTTSEMSPQVFLMALDQIQDRNETRSSVFIKDVQDFLGLQHPIRSLVKPQNKNHFHGKRAFPEIIDICDDTLFLEVRLALLERAKSTVEWMRTNFLTDPGVRVANKDHLLEILQEWTKDPCEQRTERLSCQKDCADNYHGAGRAKVAKSS